MIGYCGLTCHTCPIYVATREEDDEKRRRMRAEIAEQIMKLYGQECKPEDVTDCDGCRTESERLYSGCKKCLIRECAGNKGIENCAHCSEYPCKTLEKHFADYPEDGKLARERLDQIRNKL
ncbi:MAG TPA: DUF3795 domain-containing protein [Sedimentisphaerales bacterium]|nr:DUF3795 domain-containing protein [Sedimentisphaerales bacterium]